MEGGTVCLRNVAVLVTGDAARTVHRNVDVLVEDGFIRRIGADLPSSGECLDASRWVVYPGLVNTHHHFFQAFVRNRSEFAWPCDVLSWIARIYPEFARLTEPCFYHTALVCMADLIKHGCTTAFDHQYCFPRHAGKYLVDQQFRAADLLGMRYVAGRGANTLPEEHGGNVPADMVETTSAFLGDVERLVETYHSAEPGAMRQVVVAPCQPVNCWEATFVESLALALDKGIRLHTHLGEGESETLAQRIGERSVAWLERIGLHGADVWVAHAWDLTSEEIARLGALDVGVSHCPAPVFLVGEAVTDLRTMQQAGVRLGLGVDGCASNDGSNLAECIRTAYLLQCLVASARGFTAPDPVDYLEMATRGGAALLGRSDIGELAEGKCADLFAVNIDRLDLVGALDAPDALPAKIGLGDATAMTMINGRVVWQNGEFPGLDEAQLAAQAQAALDTVFGSVAA